MYLPIPPAEFAIATLLTLILSTSPFTVAQEPVASTTLKITDTQSSAPYTAQMTGLTESTLTISESSSTRELSVANLRRVEFSGAVPIPPGRYAIALRDGSTFSASEMSSDGASTYCTLPGSDDKLNVPTKLISDIRLRELTEPQKVQWQAIRDSRLAADMLVLVRSEETLDKIEGIINGIANESVEFEFSGQKVPAPFSKLAGIRFYSKSSNPDAKLSAVVRDTSGHAWHASAVVYNTAKATLELNLRGGLAVTIPSARLLDIDFGIGSTKYLAELQPVARTAVERFPLSIPVAGSDTLFGARVATTQNSKYGPSIEFLGSGSATYRIPPDFTRLVGSVELNPPGNTISPCIVQVMIEKKVVWEQRLAEAKRPLPIDLAVTGDQRIQLVVQSQADLPVGDTVLFKELRFVK